MKELSIEQKAKYYDEAIKQIKECTPDENGFITIYPQEIFPELEESRDERIKKAIKSIISYNVGGNKIYGFTKEELITWLEKQGEKLKKVSLWKHWKDGVAGNSEGKLIYLIKDDYTYRLATSLYFECDYIELTELDKLLSEKQGEQNPTDNVKPKFEVGDWVVLGNLLRQIERVTDLPHNHFQYWTTNGPWFGDGTEAHLWTIQDAKAGDVLVTSNQNIFIFKGINGNTVYDYCGLYYNKFYDYSNTVNGTIDAKLPKDYIPATKEQRDLLFKKMQEAGYEWDAEKKELMKIMSNSIKFKS